ncbi:clostripain-related cysteine peptidase [Paraburkholderia sp. JPY419]|uniref:clostripain-related cysteine peptidase n=1 Tax=Paraburkholderia sp. JPY419 TaxID=667660 RepID=UPI003D23990E
MKKFLVSIASFVLLLSMTVTSAAAAVAAPAPLPKWSVLIFMNGKNDLEPFALQNWRQIANAGSTDEVAIAVEFGRIGDPDEPGSWGGVKRFFVEKGMTPDAANAVQDPAQLVRNADMGDFDAFREFLAWGKKYHPAKHYMVVVWDHGAGWRANRKSSPPMRSVSFDEETQHALYNVDVSNAIQQVFGEETIDVAGFDACLMANLENAYELRSRASYLVGSEGMEPGAGWDYGFLGELVENPAMSGSDLSKSIAAHYANYYTANPSGHVTLSAIDLGKVVQIVERLDRSAASIEANAPVAFVPMASPFGRGAVSSLSEPSFDSAAAARESRAPLRYYGDVTVGAVDLSAWLDDLVAGKLTDPMTASSASGARTALRAAVLVNFYAGCSASATACGDNGLSILFPKSGTDYKLLVDASGYDRTNVFKPVAFVKETGWPKFLHGVFGIPLKL